MTNSTLVKGQLLCVALNDAKQFEAMQAEFAEAPYKGAPTQPVLYFKPHNTWNTDGATVEWAAGAEEMVVGASLAAVVGKTCCRVSPEEALEYIQGYKLVHDFSLPEKSYYRPDIRGKCLDGSAPISSEITPVTNPDELTVVTKINGEVAAELPQSQLVRSVAELISTISYIMTLQPGNLIAVGFPGDRIPVKQGDKVTSLVEGVAELNNVVGK